MTSVRRIARHVLGARTWVALLCASLLVTTSGALQPVWASVPGAPVIAEAPPLWCYGTSSMSVPSDGPGHSVGWVPAGATAKFTAVNMQIMPSRYFGSGRGEYWYRVEVSTISDGTVLWQKGNLDDVGIEPDQQELLELIADGVVSRYS